MRVLVWHSKYGDVIVSAIDDDELGRAYLYLFDQMDGEGYYNDMDNDWQLTCWQRARQGDADAAEDLLEVRNDYEYEGISIEEVVVPN